MNDRTDATQLLTVAETAEVLGTATSKVYELVATGTRRSVRIGRAIRIALDDLQNDTASDDADTPTGHLHEHLDRQPCRLASIATSRRPATSDDAPMTDRSHSAQHPSERRQPSSRETADRDTDLHPGATRRRVDASSSRQARS